MGLTLYFIGCSLAGLGFTLLATVPGTYLLARLFASPSFAFGLYFTVGGLGGVAGPLLYLWVAGISAGLARLLAGLAADRRGGGAAQRAAGGCQYRCARRRRAAMPHITSESWTAKAALRTPQFAILAAAYSIFLFVGITVNAVSVAHLMSHGVAAAVAGGMMSAEALINAGARLAGGVVSRWIDAKLLLLLSLAMLIVGLVALSAAHDLPLMLVYAAASASAMA